MKASKKCPVCRKNLVKKEVDKFLRSDGNIAVLRVSADVCLHCGVRTYSPGTVIKLTEVKKRLKKGDVKGFTLIGKSYEAAL